ncbi:hypothetical protein AAL_08312 [Moelleriella libera RCEF 2490]|uniref:CFEM domain-containing protein n=1 Tax=Moelleriella libera RCEF 2490 TaxID=1081109 RepID=A0A167VP62_9HYPO|nr:hypothetical protein AAL_08312 [Moelleriella libera RCEF 2490]
MKSAIVTLAVAGIAAAQNLDGIAPCVKSCIQNALTTVGCTGSMAQIALCACNSQSKLISPVTSCVAANSCDFNDLLKAQSIAAQQCQALATMSVSVPAGASSSSSPAAGTSGTPTSTAAVSSSTPVAGITTPNPSSTYSRSSGSIGTISSAFTTTGAPSSTTVISGAAIAGPAVGAVAALFAAALVV